MSRETTCRRAAALLAALAAWQAGSVAAASVPDLRTRKTGTDWYRFLGPNLDNRSDETGILTDWSEGRLPVVWQRQMGEGYSAPTVSRGRLFLFDRHAQRATLTCVRSETGEELWSVDYPSLYVDRFGYSGGPRASPVIDDDRVYTLGAEGRLRAHRVSGGELLWQVDTSPQFGVVENFFGVGTTPIVEGDLLISMIGGSPPESPALDSGRVTGNGSGIVAFDKRTGDVRYRISDELASYSSIVTGTVGDRRWAFAFARGGLIAFEPSTGRLEFEFPWRARKLYSVNAASPVLVGDTVLITESYEVGSALLRVRAGGYELLRRDPPRRGQSLAAHWATPIHHDGFLYGSSGEKPGVADLRCVDHRSGAVRWRQRLGARATLVYVDDHFVVLTERGRLILIRAHPERFSPVTEIDLGGLLGYPSWNAPVLSHGLLYVRGGRRLLALELIPDASR